jgi:hypothetical protein
MWWLGGQLPRVGLVPPAPLQTGSYQPLAGAAGGVRQRGGILGFSIWWTCHCGRGAPRWLVLASTTLAWAWQRASDLEFAQLLVDDGNDEDTEAFLFYHRHNICASVIGCLTSLVQGEQQNWQHNFAWCVWENTIRTNQQAIRIQILPPSISKWLNFV